MKLNSLFDNLSVYFEDDSGDAPIRASAYKNDEGDVIEIRVFNPDYNEILVVTRTGEVSAISIDDYLEDENK